MSSLAVHFLLKKRHFKIYSRWETLNWVCGFYFILGLRTENELGSCCTQLSVQWTKQKLISSSPVLTQLNAPPVLSARCTTWAVPSGLQGHRRVREQEIGLTGREKWYLEIEVVQWSIIHLGVKKNLNTIACRPFCFVVMLICILQWVIAVLIFLGHHSTQSAISITQKDFCAPTSTGTKMRTCCWNESN